LINGNPEHAWTADTDIFFLLKSDVHAGGVVSQLLGHADRLAECNVVRFLYAEKTYRHQPTNGVMKDRNRALSLTLLIKGKEYVH
jgi:hypothetical protein